MFHDSRDKDNKAGFHKVSAALAPAVTVHGPAGMREGAGALWKWAVMA